MTKELKVIFVISVIGIILVAIGLSIGFYQHKYLLVKYGKKTIGIVKERQYRRQSTIYVKCEFMINDKMYTTYTMVNDYENLTNTTINIGDEVQILYYPLDPSIAEVKLKDGVIHNFSPQ